MKHIITFLLVLMSLPLWSQTVIQMEEDGGVYKIPCLVNGAKMKFVFDTGASSVTLSSVMANYLLENDYISVDDIKGSGKSSTADGRIVDHTVIVLKDIEIAGLHIYDVEATVLENATASLLLGQSAIQKLGPIELNGNTLVIKEGTANNEDKDEQIRGLYYKACEYFFMGLYSKAKELFQKVYAMNGLPVYGHRLYAKSCYFSDDYETAYKIFNEIQDFSYFEENKFDIYFDMGLVCQKLEKYKESIAYLRKSLMLDFNGYQEKSRISSYLALTYLSMGDHDNASKYYFNALYCMEKFYNLEDGYLWKDCNGNLEKNKKSYRDDNIDQLAFGFALESYNSRAWSLSQLLKQMKIMAKAGNKRAIKFVNGLNQIVK